MSDASRIGNIAEVLPPPPVGATGGAPASHGSGAEGAGAHAVLPPSSAVEEIADDLAQVSLAGALISRTSAGSDVRFERVAALRQRIEAGTYGVASEDVAEKLMDEMQRQRSRPAE